MQRAIRSRLENVLESYNERTDCKEGQHEEPNVEKFNLENSRDEILELIASFNEPPFTIQRICELLYSPFKYYDRISTFLRGLEKNLRVISSNDWPKSRVDTKIDETTSIKSNSSNMNISSNNSNNDDVDKDNNRSINNDRPLEQSKTQQQSNETQDVT